LALGVILCTIAIAQEPKSDGGSATSGQTLEQQLLEGLHPAPGRPAASPSGSEGSVQARNPLARIAERMRTVQRRLAKRDTSLSTQEEQTQIVDDLERLLAQSGQAGGTSSVEQGTGRESAQAAAGAGDPLPSTAARSDSGGERGALKRAQQADLNAWLDQMWGQLPEKARDQMRAPRSE
jgi:hypothetical protein